MSQQKVEGISLVSLNDMKTAILKSGYLLEQRVEDVFKKREYTVEANVVFPDPYEEKSREYDLDATKTTEVFKGGLTSHYLSFSVLCECKNNPQPLVFFTKDISDDIFQYDIKVSGMPVRFWDDGAYIGLCDFTNIKRFHHHCSGVVATQWCTFSQKKKDNTWMASHSDEQHDAFTTLLKAIDYQIGRHYDSWSPDYPQRSDVDINIYYPLVILSGSLYSAILQNGKLALNKTKHVHFRKEIYQPSIECVDTYHIDVIQEQYLPTYLKMIGVEVTKIRNSLRRQKQKVIASINEIVKEASKSKTKPKSYREFLEF